MNNHKYLIVFPHDPDCRNEIVSLSTMDSLMMDGADGDWLESHMRADLEQLDREVTLSLRLRDEFDFTIMRVSDDCPLTWDPKTDFALPRHVDSVYSTVARCTLSDSWKFQLIWMSHPEWAPAVITLADLDSDLWLGQEESWRKSNDRGLLYTLSVGDWIIPSGVQCEVDLMIMRVHDMTPVTRKDADDG